MRILVLAPQPFFEPRGTPFSVLWRLKALSHLGHEVDVLTYHVGRDVLIPGVTIYRTPSIRFIREVAIGPSVVKVFLDGLLFISAYRLLLRNRYDLLHTHEEAGFFGTLLARGFGIPHLYDMHSSLPQQLKNFEFSHFGPLIYLFEWLERRVIHASDAVITICPALEEHVRRIGGHLPHVMIENVGSEEEPEDLSEKDFRQFLATHSLEQKEVLLYAGTFERYQGLDLLIASAEEVTRRHPDSVFLLMGGKPDQLIYYQKMVKDRGLSNYFRFTGMRPPDEIPVAIRLSHVLLSPRVSGTNTPLKIYAYLRSGKPIVATNLQTHTQVLNGSVAVLVEPNADALAKGIISILDSPLYGRDLGARARRFFEERYSFAKFVQKTEQVLQLAVG